MAARRRLGLSMKELGRMLRFHAGGDPGSRIRELEANRRPIGGPTAVAVELLEFVQTFEAEHPGIVQRCREAILGDADKPEPPTTERARQAPLVKSAQMAGRAVAHTRAEPGRATMVDVQRLADEELRNLVTNHQEKRATDRPLFREAVEELHRRHGGGLDVDRSLEFLRRAAARRQFVSYGQLAEANDAVWDKVRYPMNAHLWALVRLARSNGWPMLSAMIVNKQHLATGEMEPETLEGFVKAAMDLGYEVTDRDAFLRQQQEACFRWGAAGSESI
jgi:hypothetical protein